MSDKELREGLIEYFTDLRADLLSRLDGKLRIEEVDEDTLFDLLTLIHQREEKLVRAREIIACPVCLGVGTVSANFYPIESTTGTGFGRQKCRTCKGETVIDAAQLTKEEEKR